MFRRINPDDRALYIDLASEFYSTPAVTHAVPRQNFETCFDYMMRGGKLSEGYILEHDGIPAGYALLSHAYSQEAGGEVLWLEEIYIRESFRGCGLGTEFIKYLFTLPGIKRVRLEATPENPEAMKLYSRLGFETLPYIQMIKE